MCAVRQDYSGRCASCELAIKQREDALKAVQEARAQIDRNAIAGVHQ